ncbi:hypothetical protein I547_5662 [Mycobacterium kansasii 824]|uniref:Uncharacterized protein n=1 Tax=Mycobacterium kansasii TaxID=1768 RepID=A0A1V3XD67_MYCKA|nr:hypothetical protein I547_5662 [Mycobacterium kansasii 824]OOK73558.1 hypothetical protein BZL30_4826 [Mycobacterium kansasii]OOK77169.1 hypothetical protein BZL29_3927 [Mycobacterium kansasii]
MRGQVAGWAEPRAVAAGWLASPNTHSAVETSSLHGIGSAATASVLRL